MFWESKKTHQISLLKCFEITIETIQKDSDGLPLSCPAPPVSLLFYLFFFIDLGGNVTGRVIDIKPRRSPIPSAGLEIKLMLTFSGTNQEIMNKMRTFIRCYEYEYTGVRPHQQPADQDSDQESTDDEIEFN